MQFAALLDYVLPFWLVLCNKFLVFGILPNIEKLAAITRTQKKTNLHQDSTSNYHSESNLTYEYKLIEHFVCA